MIQHLTNVSFAYPDWALNDFTYKQPIGKNSNGDPDMSASLNLSLTSRATGARVRCRWGDDVSFTPSLGTITEFTLITSCVVEADPLHSSSFFDIQFNPSQRFLYLEHS